MLSISKVVGATVSGELALKLLPCILNRHATKFNPALIFYRYISLYIYKLNKKYITRSQFIHVLTHSQIMCRGYEKHRVNHNIRVWLSDSIYHKKNQNKLP